MERSRVYMARRDQGRWLIALAAPFLAVGVGLIPDGDGVACCFGVIGGTVALLGATHLQTRVEVGPAGVTKRPRVPDGFNIRWPKVESWSVVDLRREESGDTFSDRAVRFVVGWRRLEVRESEVHQPGFETFVADVRVWARCRERTEPSAYS